MIRGDRLKTLRKNKSLTQEELGNVLGVTKVSICCYEKGTRTPTLETLIDLINFFGVSADYLIGSDNIVQIKEDKVKEIITTEEMKFLKELRKNKYLSEVLLEDAKRAMELLNKKIG